MDVLLVLVIVVVIVPDWSLDLQQRRIVYVIAGVAILARIVWSLRRSRRRDMIE